MVEKGKLKGQLKAREIYKMATGTANKERGRVREMRFTAIFLGEGKEQGEGERGCEEACYEEMQTRDEVQGNLLKVAARLPREAEATK